MTRPRKHIPLLCSDLECVTCKALRAEWLASINKGVRK